MNSGAQSKFAEIYGGNHRKINKESPELKFLDLICGGKMEQAANLFCNGIGGSKAWVDAPQGRFDGENGINEFINGWLDSFEAESGFIEPVVQTVAGGRSVTELVFHYKMNGESKHIPMAAVADLAPRGMMEAFRLYFNYKWAPGFNAYRAPIFKSSDLTPVDNNLFTGAVREYFEALHTLPEIDVDRVMNVIGDRCAFGGYGPEEESLSMPTPQELRAAYERMATYIPRWLFIRVETIIDDGINCVVEWQHIITREGRQEGGRICEGGISAYERGADGKLCAIRICDYANCEPEIDWDTARNAKEVALGINYLG